MFQGVAASVVASCIFGGLYYLSPHLAPLTGEQIFGWRMLCTIPFTTLYVLYSGQWPQVVAIAQRVRAHWPLGLLLLVSAALLSVQLWIFMWAPLHGHALPVSLGYFLLPLAMVLVGRWVFGERLSRWQWCAAVLAGAGMGWELWRAGGLAWSTWVVVLGYPLYFVVRRKLATDTLAGHWIDVVLLLPACVWCALRMDATGLTGWQAIASTPALQLLVPLLGISSAIALALYMAASRLLPLGLFGLLSYVEPLLLVVMALLMGERITPGQAPMYTLIAAAVLLLALDAGLSLRRRARATATVPAGEAG